jgi:DNA-binding MarR family transcriptional regulator
MPAPEPRISYIIKRLEVAIRARLDKIAREHEITTMQYLALSVINLHPGMSSAQLAVRSFVTPQSANQMVAALEKGGFIVRQPDEINRRILRISLTEKGGNLLAEWDEIVDVFERAMLVDLSDEMQAEMRRLLLSCIGSLAEYAMKADAER